MSIPISWLCVHRYSQLTHLAISICITFNLESIPRKYILVHSRPTQFLKKCSSIYACWWTNTSAIHLEELFSLFYSYLSRARTFVIAIIVGLNFQTIEESITMGIGNTKYTNWAIYFRIFLFTPKSQTIRYHLSFYQLQKLGFR